MGNHVSFSCVIIICTPQDCKLCVAKDQACPQPARCLALSKYALSKWRSCSIIPLRLATAPTRSKLPATTEPSPARLKQGSGLSPVSFRVQNASGGSRHITGADMWVSALPHSHRVGPHNRLACSAASISLCRGWDPVASPSSWAGY